MSRDWPCWAGETLNPSLGISYNRHISNYVHCFSRIYIPTPFFTIGLQYQATWRALCLGLRIRHDSRGVGKVLRSSKPLNFQGPCSLVVVLRPLASCFWDPRVSVFEVRSYWGPSCLLSKARVPSVFEVLVPPLRVFLFATQKSSQFKRAPTQILILYNIIPFL